MDPSTDKFSELETVLLAQFKRLETEFRKRLIEKDIQVLLMSGAWVNDNGVGVGWLSCSSGDPRKESLELTLDFKLDDKNTLLDCGVYWTDGSFVEELGNFEIGSSDNIKKIISEIEQCINSISEVSLSRYLVCLIENLNKL